ncbi:MAG: transcriptional regulator, partial [Streptomyces sp.]|nr:transcriptional regulator [Streptomyces sp.]
WLAIRLAMTGVEFTVESPGELVECVRGLGERLVRAAGG